MIVIALRAKLGRVEDECVLAASCVTEVGWMCSKRGPVSEGQGARYLMSWNSCWRLR